MWGAGGGGVGRERSREEEVFEGRSEGRKEKGWQARQEKLRKGDLGNNGQMK